MLFPFTCLKMNIHWGPQSMMYLKGKRKLPEIPSASSRLD